MVAQRNEANDRANDAASKLESLGYEEHMEPGVFGGGLEYSWHLTPEAKAVQSAEADDRREYQLDLVRSFKRDIEKARADAAEKTRRETLAAVIEALGIKGYSPATRLYASLMGGNEETDRHLQAEHDRLQAAHADRFWNDLQTTLRVRAEKAQREADEKTAEKVAGLIKPEAPKATGGYIGSLNNTVSFSDIAVVRRMGDELGVKGDGADFADTVTKLASPAASTPTVEDARPEKAPQGITRRVDGKKPAKSKKGKE
ncbi:hypothetical protein [Microbacterium sp. zg-YB36]|uniref:hypothetical protein n=1 Tax=Microbacterium sp. zg-YB36 TaxID=2969407 RepID=UPI00214B5E5B|nr:hypothetical protein [Microbacterium sp. zg-YB36]MDL5351185.1 hypothetical protein [Microbacterium sp. zg-YB36]